MIDIIIGILMAIAPMVAFLLGMLVAELEYRSTMGKFPFKKPYLERKWGIKSE